MIIISTIYITKYQFIFEYGKKFLVETQIGTNYKFITIVVSHNIHNILYSQFIFKSINSTNIYRLIINIKINKMKNILISYNYI